MIVGRQTIGIKVCVSFEGMRENDREEEEEYWDEVLHSREAVITHSLVQ